MRPRSSMLLASLCLATNPSIAAQKPLAQDEAGVVGSWSGVGPVKGIVLQSVVDIEGCLKLGPAVWIVSDHPAIDHPTMSTVVRLKPGRYAISGASWSEPWQDQYDMVGISRPDGEMWTVDLAAGVVTDIGVWSVTSPYIHRYVPTTPDPAKGASAAKAATDGVAPLVMARWVRAEVIEADAACAPVAVSGK